MYLVKKIKTPFWQVVYIKNGKATSKSTKKRKKSDALIFLSEFEKHINKNPQPIKINITGFQNEYISLFEKSKSKSYVRSINLSFEQLTKYTGEKNINEIGSKDIEKFINETFERSQYAAGLYYRTLKAAFSKAVSWGYLETNHFKKIKLSKVSSELPIFINENEFQKIIKKTNEKLFKDIFTFAFNTGMRQGEIVNMQWGWINFENKIITVKNSDVFKTKSKRERIIPMNDTVKNLLAGRLPKLIKLNSANDYVFNRIRGVKLNEDFLSKNFKKSVRNAKLKDEIHFHTLRHSFASILVQRGVSLYVVKELLGHSDLRTTQIYAHLQKENLFEAINKL